MTIGQNIFPEESISDRFSLGSLSIFKLFFLDLLYSQDHSENENNKSDGPHSNLQHVKTMF